jgi:hypothetical protein
MGQAINIVLRGQSNSMLFAGDSYLKGAAKLDAAVERYLGFEVDGTDPGAGKYDLKIIADIAPWRTPGPYTINDGTAFLNTSNPSEPSWITPVNGDWRQGWQNTPYETGLLQNLARAC